MKRIMMLALGLLACSCWAEVTCLVKLTDGAIGEPRTATVTYAGGGTNSPLVRVEAGDGAYVRFTEADGWSKSVEFLALGGEGTQDFLCLADSKGAKLKLSYTQGSSEAIPWSTLGDALRPSYVDSTAWSFAQKDLKSRLGSTWSDYLARLKANADYLSGLGYQTRRTDRLLALEVNRALGINAAMPTLAAATDIVRAARGLPLVFSRSFSSAMYTRFNRGVLGYGWTDNYSVYAERVDETTLVIRLPSGGAYAFSKVTGTWRPEDARDVTTLTETDDAYALTSENGLLQTFAKSNMRLKTVSDNVGHTLTFTWDETRLQSVVHSDGQKLTFSYDDNGLLKSVKDDLGRRVSYAYNQPSGSAGITRVNANTLLVAVTDTAGLVTSYGYDRYMTSLDVRERNARSLISVTYPDKTSVTFKYTRADTRLCTIKGRDGGTVSLTYPDVGTVKVTAPDGGVTTVAMGPFGEVLKATDALGNVVTRTYDGDGLLKSIFAPSGKSGQYAYDVRGRVTEQTSAAGNKTTFDYTELFGNLKTLKDARSQSVTYGYDDKGRATSVTFPDGSKMLVAYNAKGDVSKTTNGRGQSETYGYDAEGRVTSRRWANGRTFTYAYDTKGRLVTATDSESGRVTMAYDTGDRLTSIEYPNGYGFTFSYDAAGRLTKRTALDGMAECYAYDAAGRLSTVTDDAGTLYVSNAYDATTGRMTGQTYGNGSSTAYSYDLCGRIVSIVHKDAAGTVAENLTYRYDADGRCVRATSLLGEERYAYDDDGQLTSVTYPSGDSETFAYDAVGNRTSAKGATYTANSLNQYTTVKTASRTDRLTYDADGNLMSRTGASGTTTYAYDQQNRLVAVSNPAQNLDWSCTYDALGNRVSVTTNGVTTTRVMLPGSLPSVAAEYRNGSLVRRHIVVGAAQIAEIDAKGASRYYHGDLIGSARLVMDATGTMTGRLAYKAFGEVRSHTGEAASAGYVGLLGVETDPTGLLFMRNRYYDPSLGRFIQRDPIGLSGGDVNWYRYCGNAPIIKCDLTGLAEVSDVVDLETLTSKIVGSVGGMLSVKGSPVASLILLAHARHASATIQGNSYSWVDFVKDALPPSLEAFASYAFGISFVGELVGLYNDISDKINEDLVIDELLESVNPENYEFVPKWFCYDGVCCEGELRKITSEMDDCWPDSDTYVCEINIAEDSSSEDGDKIPESVELSVSYNAPKNGNAWSGEDSFAVTVDGPCIVSFEMKVQFRLMSESGGMDFYVDGASKGCGYIAPQWGKFSVAVSGSGKHQLEWRLTGKFFQGYAGRYPDITGSVRNIKVVNPYCAVTFDPNGGMVSETSRTVHRGKALGTLPTPTAPKGWAFKGWYTTAQPSDSDEAVTDSTIVSKNLTLYAKWAKYDLVFMTPKEYSQAFFLANDATSTVAVTSFRAGEIVYANFCFGNRFPDSYTDFAYRITMGRTVLWGGAIPDTHFLKGGNKYSWWNKNLYLGGFKPGTYTVVCTLDADNDIEETDESNNTRSITFNVLTEDGREPVTVTVDGKKVTAGAGGTFGSILKDPPARKGWTFEGWYTGKDGTGTRLTPSSTVPSTPTKVYPYWVKDSAPDYRLCEDVGDVADLSAATVYSGYLMDGDGAVAGTIQVKAAKAKANRKTGATTSKLSVTIQPATGKKVSLKGDLDVDAGAITIASKDGRTLDLELGENGILGTYGEWEIDGARDVFSSKASADKAVANDMLAKWKGTLALVFGDGSLTVTVGAKGKAKVSGTLANGTKVSASAQMIVGDEWCCIPVVVAKKGVSLAFCLWLSADSETADVTGLGEDFVLGRPGALGAGASLVLGSDALAQLIGDGSYKAYFPNGVSVEQRGTKWVVADGAKAGKVVLGRDGLVDAAKAGANPSALRLIYRAKDGTFSGSFKAYVNARGKPKAVSVSVSGVVIDGVGYGTVTVKNLGSIPVMIE